MSTDALRQRLETVQGGIAAACADAGRSADEITLIVVTKFHPAQLVRDLYDLGVRNMGENRHQEAMEKAAEVGPLEGLRWNYIGQLQTNKARQVFQYADAIHSIDRVRLVNAIDKAESDRVLEAFIQVNLTEDPGRGGVAEAELNSLAERVLESPRLKLSGVMAVAPLDEDPRPAFERVAKLSQQLQTLAPDADKISAGMSHDYAAAIEFGATHLRIGSAITGNRDYSK